MMTDDDYAGSVLEDGIAANVEYDADAENRRVAVSVEVMADDVGLALERNAAQIDGSGVVPEN